jgi:hypothetical protein
MTNAPPESDELEKILDKLFPSVNSDWKLCVGGKVEAKSAITSYAERMAEERANRLLDKVEKALPQNKVFPGGRDDGMSDQIDGYNVAINRMRQALQQLRASPDKKGGE